MDSPLKFVDSFAITQKLKNLNKTSQPKLLLDDKKQRKVKADVKKRKEARLKGEWTALHSAMDDDTKRAMIFAREKGESCLFTVLPLEEQGFVFHAKQDFRDVVRMRY